MRQNSRRSVPKYGAGSQFFLKKPPGFTFFQKSMPPAQKNEQECGAAGAFTAADRAEGAADRFEREITAADRAKGAADRFESVDYGRGIGRFLAQSKPDNTNEGCFSAISCKSLLTGHFARKSRKKHPQLREKSRKRHVKEPCHPGPFCAIIYSVETSCIISNNSAVS